MELLARRAESLGAAINAAGKQNKDRDAQQRQRYQQLWSRLQQELDPGGERASRWKQHMQNRRR